MGSKRRTPSSRDAQLRQRFRQQLEKNSITSPNIFGVWGIALAYQHGLPWLDALNGYLRSNAHYLADAIQTHFPEWKMMTPESSYLAWIDVSGSGRTATEVVNHFAHHAGSLLRMVVIMFRMASVSSALTLAHSATGWNRR
ncbi:Cystathionine beta-lyase PatB [Kluyvera cryocrescens]|uniref:Cystathionine beta-lyase PatB n=1 Tax=Kluyvera cryocrescens TaxID=580 RepID=A0A485AKL3_KLUCR|nr:Cystathionine beta-lyase PatB [Kluyvera cryocrescens]